ncbi:hypothetical protein H6F44_11805 [Pseudanabaena sp. FACHB-1277]|uniref:Uncharacterized protein n=1 Tax=Pseudanabaena cinerea FACHB-1277 TaxID=2949581 RepID=A0A926Z889_9CYAN|nr:hypothetical protein [Pseudanabaena cinerea]MBD2150799.1 hypothetical protein [Pseudanabaena cinerea FACHB-1277]
MTDRDVLEVLAKVSPRAAKSRYIRETLNIPKSSKNAKTVLQCLGRLQAKGQAQAYKPDPLGEKKYWFITEQGKQSLKNEQ